MTAGGEQTGLHKRWMERKLEIEVGKVQAKLLSKGLSIPIPDPEIIESEARLSQAHLPKLYIDLYGRNPNGTLKVTTDVNRRNGPVPAPTVVQKLDRILNPAALTPIPLNVALAYGLPLSCCDPPEANISSPGAARGAGALSPPFGGSRTAPAILKVSPAASPHSGLHGGLSNIPFSGAPTESGCSAAVVAATAVLTLGVGGMVSPRLSRSNPPAAAHQVRADLQAVDGRIEEAVAEVYRVALQANGMCPRERVLYLARLANPNFSLQSQQQLQQRNSVQLTVPAALIGHAGGPSRRDVIRKSVSKRVSTLVPDSLMDAAGGTSGAGRGRKGQGASRRSITYAENCRSHELSITSIQSYSSNGAGGGSGGGAGGGEGAGVAGGEGALPPLGPQSRSGSRRNSSHEVAAAHHPTTMASSLEASALSTEALPRLSLPVLTVVETECEELCIPPLSPSLPRISSTHLAAEVLPGSARGSLQSLKAADSLAQVGVWGAAANILRVVELEAARAAAEFQAAEEEAAQEVADAEPEPEPEAEEGVATSQVEVEARAGAGLLALPPGTASIGFATEVAAPAAHAPHRGHVVDERGMMKGDSDGSGGGPQPASNGPAWMF